MDKVTLEEQVAAVERASMNHRAHVKNLWKLVSEKKRPENEALMAQSWLEAHEAVTWVNYAGLKNNPTYELHQKYCPNGAGAVFTFGLKGGYDAGVKLVSEVELFSHLANVGDTRSLIIHPASTTHSQLSDEQKTMAGAGPDVVRVSIGIEDVADIIADLEQAL